MPRAPRVLAVAALAGASLLAGSAALAQEETTPPADPPNQIMLAGDVIVHRGEDVGEVVVLHGSAAVGGVVHGDVVVLDGPIAVTGQVSGSVVALNGPVTIGPNAQVLGDVMGRDRIRVAEGARIDGTIRQGAAFTFRSPIDVFGPYTAWLAVAVSTLALGALLVLLAPRGADAVATAAIGSPVASAGIGLGVFLLLPILGVLAVASLVGLPFGIGLLLALAFLFSIGFTWSVYALGRGLWREPRSRWLALLFGWAIVAALSAIPYVGAVLWVVGAILGLGAMTVAAWRARGGGRHRPGAKMPERLIDLRPEPPQPQPEPMITERAMGEEGSGI
jgi:hypothetical protein